MCANGACGNAGQQQLVISELNGGRNFVELFNGGGAALNLQNYLVQWTSADGGSGSVALPSYDVPAQGFVVLGITGQPDAGRLAVPMPVSAADFALRLVAPSGSGVDFVRLGQSLTPPATGTAWNGANAQTPTPATRQSLVRNLFSSDTDSAADWSLVAFESPGTACGRPGLCGTTCIDLETAASDCGGCGNVCAAGQVCRTGRCVAGGGRLLISEYRLTPVPSVELYNPGAVAVPLAGWRVQVVGAATFLFTAPAYTLLPGRTVVIHAVPGLDDANSLYAGAPPSGAFTDASAVTLFDGTMPVDFVRFGASTVVPPGGVSWFGAGVSYPPVSSLDVSVHRKLDVIDTDSNADFVTFNPASLGYLCQPGLSLCDGRCVNTQVNASHCGACNAPCAAPLSCNAGQCAGVTGVVLARLANTVPERFELYNGGPAAVTLDAWSVEWVSESSTDNFTLPTGTTLQPGGWLSLVEGSGSNAPGVLFMGRSITWSTAIAVTLRNATVQGVDFVRTGSSTVMPTAPTTWAGAMNAANPSDTANEVLQRTVTSPDTNSAADWSIVSPATFGSACGAGLTLCGPACVSLQDSREHCGQCGNRCPDGCAAGQCVRGSGTIRLSDGTQNSGRLEVFRNGQWGTVCDDNFDLLDATVACRELGFTSAVSTATVGGGASLLILMDDVACTGTESSLLLCPFNPVHNCSASENVGVTCQ